MSDVLLVSVPNVSAPVPTPTPCAYGTPIAGGCALESPPMPAFGPAAPVPTLDEWAVIVLVAILAVVGVRRAR